MQETRVPSLIREDPTAEQISPGPQLSGLPTRAREPCAAATEAYVPRARAPQRAATIMRSPCPHSPQPENSLHSNRDPAQAKINK